MQLQPNTLFHNHYTLVQLIGRGGFSEVWLAKDKYTGLDLALKIYAPNGGIDNDGIETFAGEIGRIYNLNHPNLLKTQHFDVCNGIPYLIMPYCASGSVTKRAGQMSEDEIWNILHDVAAGLAYLHEHNIVHQDIKPDNIMQAADTHYVITDFGISTKTRATLSKTQLMNNVDLGTAAYMAPERFSTNPAPTFASDIWALGATLYELITGSVPFGDGNLPGGLLQKSGAELPSLPAGISDSLREIIMKSLSLNPSDRPKAAELMHNDAKPPIISSPISEKTRKVSPWRVLASTLVIMVGFIIYVGIKTGDYWRGLFGCMLSVLEAGIGIIAGGVVLSVFWDDHSLSDDDRSSWLLVGFYFAECTSLLAVLWHIFDLL